MSDNADRLRILLMEVDRTRTARLRQLFRQVVGKTSLQASVHPPSVRRALRSGDFDVALAFAPPSPEAEMLRAEFASRVPFLAVQESGLDVPASSMATAPWLSLALDEPHRWRDIIMQALTAVNLHLEVDSTDGKEADVSQEDRSDEMARWPLLAEIGGDLIAEIDERGHFVYASHNYRELLGYSPKELIGRDALQLVHPDEVAIMQQRRREAAAGSLVERLDFRLLHRDGHWRWFEGAAKARTLASGEMHLLFVSRDISERKRREQESQALLSLGKAINGAESFSDLARALSPLIQPLLPYDELLVSLMQPDGSLQAASYEQPSETSEKMRPLFSLRRDTPTVDPQLWRAIDQRDIFCNNEFLTPLPRENGASARPPLRAFLNVPLVIDDRVAGVLHFNSATAHVFTADHLRFAGLIGEQVAAALRQSTLLAQNRVASERFRGLVNHIDAVLWEADAEPFRLVWVSPQVESWFGYAASSWLEESEKWLERIHPDDRERVAMMAEQITTLDGGEPEEIRMLTAEGKVLWVRPQTTLERVAGQGTRVHGLLIDVTAQQRLDTERAALIALAKTVNAQHELEAVASAVSVHLQPLIPFDLLYITLLREGEYRVVSADLPPDELGNVVFDKYGSPNNPFWAQFDQHQIRLNNDFYADEPLPTDQAIPFPHRKTNLNTRAFINAPLIVEGQVIGLLHLDGFRPNVFTHEHIRLAGLAAEQVAVAVRQIDLLRQALEAEAQASEAGNRYGRLVNQIDAVAWEADAATMQFTYVSPRAEAWFGYPTEEWLTSFEEWARWLHPDDRERVLEECRVATLSGRDHVLEFRLVSRGGKVLWMRDLVSVEVEDGRAVRLNGIMFDITERHDMDARMLEANTVLQATQESGAEGMILVDEDGNVCSCNRRFAEMWQIPPDMVRDLRENRQLLLCVLAMLQDPDEFTQKMADLSDYPATSTRDEVTLSDGRVFERFSAPALSPEGRSFGRVWSFSDITERKLNERQLAHQAFHDSLTDLPNRTLFMENLVRSLARAQRSGSLIAVLFLDLDRFKIVNDSLGHETGDLLLIESSRRLTTCLRPGDLAARFGGDEFTVLLEDIHDLSDATQVAGRIADALGAPFDLGGHEITTTASVGIVLSHGGNVRAEDLLRDADVAMYRAKNRGRARYEIFDSAMSAQAFARLKLEIELRHSIPRGQMRLHFQPFIDLRTGHICGGEALVRWQHPERGLILPGEFISLAEESGMIYSLGQWVLDEACRQAQQWRQKYRDGAPLMISVNLSARQFLQSHLVDDIAGVLMRSGLPPRLLNLEITETALLEAGEATSGVLRSLRELGAHLSIDDFGTGYSSLSYLRRFPLDILKVDRSFVERACSHEQDHAIVRAVHQLAQALGMKVIAEGVETREQLQQLRNLGCDIGQGYFFSRPLPAADFEKLLETHISW